ncbi:MAG: acetoacetate decarboxylase family protein [Gammaproteobacteria bacterium]
MTTMEKATAQTLNDPFFQVPRTTFPSTQGPVDLPIFYYDSSALQAFFLPKRARVERLLAGTGLVPALTIGQRALAGIACYEYRHTTVGSYNEVGVAVAVCRDGEQLRLNGWSDLLSTMRDPESRHVAFHILDLPVTTAAANAAGREVWGYPKFVADIPFRLEGRDFACSVMAPGTQAPVMELAGRVGPSVPVGTMGLTLLSFHDGQLVRATVNARGPARLATPGSLRLKADGSRHPMGERLLELGLDGAAPFAVSWTHAFQSRLNAGTVID